MDDQSPPNNKIAAQAERLGAALDRVDAALTKHASDPSPDQTVAALSAPVRALAAAAKE